MHSAAKKTTVAIVGAGPGGLTAGMILASKGIPVKIYEKNAHVGGRSCSFKVGHTKFDLGPTLLLMRFVLDQVFQDAGNRRPEQYMDLTRVEPMYRLQFTEQQHVDCYSQFEKRKMNEEFARTFPHDAPKFDKWIEHETARYRRLMPILQRPYNSLLSMVNPETIRAIPWLALGRSVLDLNKNAFKDPNMQISLSFQTKYLGMTPWQAPGFFNIVSFVEHFFGVYHTKGGLSEISDQMANVVRECGGEINFNSGVKNFIIEPGTKKVKGFVLENGEEVHAEHVIMNAEFTHNIGKLVPNAEQVLNKWKPSTLEKKKYSSSTFMMYLSLDKLYDQIPHHNIVFADDYMHNLKLVDSGTVPTEPSIYVRNASITDPTLSPEGKSGIYVLAPVPNLKNQPMAEARKFWGNQENVANYRSTVLKILERKLGAKNISQHIEAERIITPVQWNDDGIFKGAVFSLAHNIMQMLAFRPRNKFEDLENLYLVGAGTHPGSGLPTIYESARISSDLICQELGVKYQRTPYVLP